MSNSKAAFESWGRKNFPRTWNSKRFNKLKTVLEAAFVEGICYACKVQELSLKNSLDENLVDTELLEKDEIDLLNLYN